MIDPIYVLDKLGLKDEVSVTRAVIRVGEIVSGSSDKLSAANKIISSLGGDIQHHPIKADIIAKALVEHAIVTRNSFEPSQAMTVAIVKLNKIMNSMPYLFSDQQTHPSVSIPKTSRASPRSNDKKPRALEIYNREKGKSATEIAKLIANELEITFANAYYYVSRVFNKGNL